MYIGYIGEVYQLRAKLKALIIPLIVSSIIAIAIGSLDLSGLSKNNWVSLAIAYFFITTILAIVLACIVLVLAIQPGAHK